MDSTTFNSEYRRLCAIDKYDKAFRLCLDNVKDRSITNIVMPKAHELIKLHAYMVMDAPYHCTLTVNRKLDINWLIDIAITAGYKNGLKFSKMSTGLFSYIPCIQLPTTYGLARHRFGVEQNKDGSSTIYYKRNKFCSDFKMVRQILEEVLLLYSSQA